MIESTKITLTNFEGPLDLLLYLIQRNEINIYDIPIHSITKQFLEEKLMEIDTGAEFLGGASSLLLLKSERLLPKIDRKTEEEDPYIAVLKGLIEYCTFKEVAKTLSQIEDKERFHFTREIENEEFTKEAKLPEITLEELQSLFQKIINKKTPSVKKIEDTSFFVEERIDYLLQLVKTEGSVQFKNIFLQEKSKDELIATFLALLQLMKMGELIVTKDTLCIQKP